MSHTRSPTKVDWVQSRLDEIRNDGFKLCQGEKETLITVRKASFGMMESKHSVAHKKKLYRIFDSIYDTVWLRFVFIGSSKFEGLDTKDALSIAHGHFLLLSSIALELRTGIFDLLELMTRIKAATSSSSVGSVSTPEFTTKSLTKLYGLNTMLNKLSELVNEVKIKLSGAKDKLSAGSAGGPALAIPSQVEAPIMLLEERLKHFSSLDREALFNVHPPLKDLRHSLAILYQLRCDDAAVGLALGDTLGEAYLRIMQSSAALRDDFAAPILEAFHCCRANAWLALRDIHQLDLNTTAKSATPTPSGGAQKPAVNRAPTTPSKHVYESASSADAVAAPETPANSASSASDSAASPSASSPPAASAPSKPAFDSAPPPLLSSTQTSYVPLSATLAAASSAQQSAMRSGSMVDSDYLPPPPPQPPTGSTASTTTDSTPAPVVVVVPTTASATLARRSLPPVPGKSPSGHNSSPSSVVDSPSPIASSPAPAAAASSSPAHSRPLPAIPTPAPTAAAAVAPAPVPAPVVAPPEDDWTEVKGTNGSQSYFWNVKTGVSAWVKPTAPTATTAAPVAPAPSPAAATTTEAAVPATRSAARLSQLDPFGEGEEEELVAAAPTATVAVTTNKPASNSMGCGFADCGAPKFPGKQFCIVHQHQ